MAERDRLMGRNGQLWKLYVRGVTQDQLAERFGLTQAAVSLAIAKVRDSIPQQERDALIKEELDLFRQLRAEVLELWDKEAPFLVSNGRVMEGIEDHSGRLAALARAESLSARMHRITGIESAAKVDLTLQGEEEAAKKAAAQALTHLHGGQDGSSD